MATINRSIVFFTVCLFLLCHGSIAQLFSQGTSQWQSARRGSPRECRLDRLQALEPLRSVKSQAGTTEFYDASSEMFQCTGVSVVRRVIEPKGLLLPRYTNTPTLVYIIQGRGITGPTFPGCPETYQQQFQQSGQAQVFEGQSQSHQFRDEHQKIHRFRQGDVVALPAGIAHWCYNDGEEPVVAIYVSDTNNGANQLEPRQRDFLLAGNKRGQQTYRPEVEERSQNVFSGFSVELLSEALGISRGVARQLQSQNDPRGEIVHAERGLAFLQPYASLQEQEQEQEQQQQQQQQQVQQEEYYQPRPYQQQQYGAGSSNGLDENFCTMRVRQNIDNPNLADTYNPRAGRITHLNSQKFPILNLIQMSAVKVNLYQDALLSPFWNINAHSVVYITQGSARVQVVNNRGKTVFNGELRRGQLLIIPEHHVVLKKAQREGCAYIAFKTNPNSMVSHIAGKSSIFRALPNDVIATAYRISREEARRLKNNRGNEFGAFTPSHSYRGYQDVAGGAQSS
ncbi:glutelin type-A 1-like [Phragmites australis]|uniref:glutelin type-A 1-like n=1 Tax=Phragmites australis TaxID=29695 RepID=UPI002D78A328|nr:glutelin type-A 1-like [Phragmites australis]